MDSGTGPTRTAVDECDAAVVPFAALVTVTVWGELAPLTAVTVICSSSTSMMYGVFVVDRSAPVEATLIEVTDELMAPFNVNSPAAMYVAVSYLATAGNTG